MSCKLIKWSEAWKLVFVALDCKRIRGLQSRKLYIVMLLKDERLLLIGFLCNQPHLLVRSASRHARTGEKAWIVK
jgi:hypothetical protein